jgi:hypothetical protein
MAGFAFPEPEVATRIGAFGDRETSLTISYDVGLKESYVAVEPWLSPISSTTSGSRKHWDIAWSVLVRSNDRRATSPGEGEPPADRRSSTCRN